MTTALSHVTKRIKLPTTALLTCALRECIRLKELTLPMNLARLIQITADHFSASVQLYWDEHDLLDVNVNHGHIRLVQVNKDSIKL